MFLLLSKKWKSHPQKKYIGCENISSKSEEIWHKNLDEIMDHIETIELNNLHAEMDENKNGIEDEEER